MSVAILRTVGTAGAVQQIISLFSRNSAFAEFTSPPGSDPCISTSAFLLGSHTIPGNPTSSAGTFAFYNAFNLCTHDFVSGEALGGPTSFAMNNLDFAAAVVAVPISKFVFDPVTSIYTQTPLGTAIFSVQWHGIGTFDKIKFSSRFVIPGRLGAVFLNKFYGKFRDATVNATLTLADQNLLAGLEVSNGMLGDATQGQRVVTRP